MINSTQNDGSEGAGTGPQGTRVVQRDDEELVAERDRAAGASGEPDSGAVLMGINGALKGRRFNIPPGRSTLGRDATNNIVVEDDSVSLVHARLVDKNGQWRVLNLLSTNGTWVNNKKVSDSALRDGDSVCFGEAEFIFQDIGASRSVGIWSILRRWFGNAR